MEDSRRGRWRAARVSAAIGTWLLVAHPCAAAETAGVSVEPLRALEVQHGAHAVTLGSLLDRDAPTVVALWASYCVECRGETAPLQAAQKRFGAKVVVVLSDVADPKTAATFRRETKTPFDPIPLAAGQEDAAEDLAPEGFPTNFLLAGGRVTRIDRVLTTDDLATFFRSQ